MAVQQNQETDMATAETLIHSQAREHAEATVTVERRQSSPFAEGAGPALLELGLEERFCGDWDGKSTVRALQIAHSDRSSSLVSLQQFRGSIGGRAGTFVLRGKGTVEEGNIVVNWSVVPESGTGHLAGLRGEGGFEGEFGKGSRAMLDYWFE
jgi:hypothetical protein